MKIGIFGDSFASKVKKNNTISWYEILKQQHTVDVFGFDGYSLYQSLKEIKQLHANYDKIILTVTNPGRIHIPSNSFLTEINTFSLPSVETIDYILKTNLNLKNFCSESSKNKITTILESVKHYYIHIQDIEYETYLHSLMLNDLISIRDDIILIPSFSTSFPKIPNIMSMFDIFQKENVAWDIKDQYARLDLRNCHLTEENNIIFGQQVLDCINSTKLEINLDNFVTPTNKEFYII